MATAHDVAAYILEKQGRMTAMKLQKLLYYCQAWSLVWDDRPLFHDRIEAWANGPVVPAVFNHHRGQYEVRTWSRGDAEVIRAVEDARATVDVVIQAYGKRTSLELSQLTHREDPWRNARKGLAPGERGNREITKEALMDYYSNLVADSEAN